MRTVQKIIETHGGLIALRKDHIRIEHEPWMRLVIEHIGHTEEGWPLISVAHYGEQHGDAMRDPEMVFAVQVKGGRIVSWFPMSFRNDYVAYERETTVVIDGKTMIRPKLVKELQSFARMWDRNIREQGFLSAAILAARRKAIT